MTYEQFWEQDVWLVKAYREAFRLKQELREQDLWVQGAYIYEAILDASPVLHDFAKKGTKPLPYRDRPIGLYGNTHQTTSPSKVDETPQQKNDNKAKQIMEMMMVSINKRFEKAGGDKNGG